MKSRIHPSALVDEGAILGKGVEIGPYCIVEEGAIIGDCCQLRNHVVVRKGVQMGLGNVIFGFASLGEVPQDLKFQGEDTQVIIGDYNTIRESCTLHRGTQEGGKTVLGSHNLLMVNTHLAHDCVVGSHNVFGNNTGIAGHVRIGDWTVLGGQTGVHQFVQIGSYAITAGASLILKDVAPFSMVAGNPAKYKGINVRGLDRRGFDVQTRKTIKQAHSLIFRKNLSAREAQEALLPLAQETPHIALLVEALDKSTRGMVR